MKKSALLVALSAASLMGGVAFAQTKPETTTRPATDTKPQTTSPSTDVGASAGFKMMQLDKNKDGSVDKQEARASASLSAMFDKADINKDGKLDSAELSAASSMSKTK